MHVSLGIFLTAHWCRGAQLTVGGSIPRPGELALWERELSLKVGNVLSYLKFLSLRSSYLASLKGGLVTCKMKLTLSSPSCFWPWCLSKQHKTKLEHLHSIINLLEDSEPALMFCEFLYHQQFSCNSLVSFCPEDLTVTYFLRQVWWWWILSAFVWDTLDTSL